MNIKNIFKVSALTSALVLAGCGGDINIQPTSIDNSVDNSVVNGGGTTNPTVNPCTTRGEIQGEFDGQDCRYTREFASAAIEIEDDLTFAELDNSGVHYFLGALQIGRDCDTTTSCTVEADGPTLTVEPGATLAFTSGEAIIRIGRGANIEAIGTFEKPITFTSANAFDRLDIVGKGPQFADWGGIIINGMGITNQCTNKQRDESTCSIKSEGIPSYFGGSNNADDSGAIKYAKIWYAGSGPKDGGLGDDLNSLTLNAVGSATEFDFIHIHQGFDDGIEFFGGAANISHIVVTDTQDDGIDVDAGWQGNGQYIFVKHGTVATTKDVVIPAEIKDGVVITPARTIPAGTDVFMGNNGFETDGEKNGGDLYSEAPASNPTFANVTVITTDGESARDGDPSQAFTFDDAIMSSYYNVLIVKEDGTEGTSCIQHKSDGEKNADMISFTTSAMACVNEFIGDPTFVSGKEPAALTGTAKSTWFENSGSSLILPATDVVFTNAFATDIDAASFTVAATDPTTLSDSFFQAGSYIGAVSDADTSSQWYQWVDAAVTAADQD